MKFSSLLKTIIVLAVLTKGAWSTYIVCYFESWATYREGAGKYDVENIDAEHCTHILYAFAGIDPNTYEVISTDPDNDLPSGSDAYRRFTSLVSVRSDLVPVLSVGGWDEGSIKFSQMAASETNRQTFIASCLRFCSDYNFKGIDIDWEYPTQRGGKPEDKENFVTLLQELRAALQPNGYTLSAAVASNGGIGDSAYDISSISDNLDFINLMLYDFHAYDDGDRTATHNAPLDSRPEEDQSLNDRASVYYWLNGGAEPSKLILGTAFYGHSFQLSDPNNHEPGDAISAPGAAGQYTQDAGTLGYFEICTLGWTTERDSYWQAPYSYNGDQWVGYDDVQSIEAKCAMAMSLGLGGGMTWSIDTDDYNNNCGQGANPLLMALFNNC